jgi:hypothetical protein
LTILFSSFAAAAAAFVVDEGGLLLERFRLLVAALSDVLVSDLFVFFIFYFSINKFF